MKNILVLCTGNSCRSQIAEGYIDISSHTSNNVNEYVSVPFDYVITVCDSASERCPVFPGNAQRFHHTFPDPAKATGSEEEIFEAFRSVRDMIRVYAADFVKVNVH